MGPATFLIVGVLRLSDLPPQEPPNRQGGVREEARVERVVVDAYVTDSRGDPIPGITTSDFRVRVSLPAPSWPPRGRYGESIGHSGGCPSGPSSALDSVRTTSLTDGGPHGQPQSVNNVLREHS